jgi:hypothetical protein
MPLANIEVPDPIDWEQRQLFSSIVGHGAKNVKTSEWLTVAAPATVLAEDLVLLAECECYIDLW